MSKNREKIQASIFYNMRGGQNHVHRRESDRQTDRQTDGRTDGQTDGQGEMNIFNSNA